MDDWKRFSLITQLAINTFYITASVKLNTPIRKMMKMVENFIRLKSERRPRKWF